MPEFTVEILKFVEDWLEEVTDKKAVATLVRVLEMFEKHGPIPEGVPRTSLKHLFDGIWEIRINQCRVGYFWDGDQCILLHGIVKKSNSWPLKDVKLLKKRRSKYRKDRGGRG